MLLQPGSIWFWAPVILFLGCLSGYLLWENRCLHQANEELRKLARSSGVDPLTGLYNRGGLTRWAQNIEHLCGVAVVVDINDFKLVNDTYGHQAGDEVICGVGRLIRSSVRDEDFACRYGGDEFVMVFRDEALGTVRERMKSIEHRLQLFRIRNSGFKQPIRISWGAADIENSNLSGAIKLADELMYRQKSWRKQLANPAV
jgi:diguanylate cyclase (GGDEF)-like protein